MKKTIVLLLAVIAALGVAAFITMSPKSDGKTDDTLSIGLPKVFQETEGLVLFEGGALPEITFIDENSEPRDLKSLEGRWNLLFFGYTYCPDICPMTLMHMNKMWKQLSTEEKAQLNIVLVSVDPERDTSSSMKQYMDYFNPAFIALTGNPDGMREFAGQLNAFYARVDRDDGGYLMDHSANIVLISPKGEYRGYIEPPHDPQRMLPVVRALMRLPSD